MKSCIVCDAIIEDNAIFCDACGALQDAKKRAKEKTKDEAVVKEKEDEQASETKDDDGLDTPSPEEEAGSVPSPLDDLIPSRLPEIPSAQEGSFAPPAPIEFASKKPPSTATASDENYDTIPGIEATAGGNGETIPPPITLEGTPEQGTLSGEGVDIDISAEETDPGSAADNVEERAEDARPLRNQEPPPSLLTGDPSANWIMAQQENAGTRPVLVAVLMGLFFLCLATWFVSKENQAYEAENLKKVKGVASAQMLALGEVTLSISGTLGADVLVDGNRVGKIPFNGKIPAGRHLLVVAKKDFASQKNTFTVKKGEKFEIDVKLTKVTTGMVWVAPGPFFRGCDLQKDPYCQRYRSEQPGRNIELDGFHIDTTEVTVAEFSKCVTAGVCSPAGLNNYTGPVNGQGVPIPIYSEMCNWGQTGRGAHPLNCVTWYEGEQFCNWQEKHLPTEAQWEKAARGTAAQFYPWGNAEPSCHFAVIRVGANACSQRQTWNVGSKPEGQSPFGAMDMVGNVSEWVWDRFSAVYYGQAPSKNPIGATAGFHRGIRGGAWSSIHTSGELRTSYRWRRPPTFRSIAIGFRCAKPAAGERSVIADAVEAAKGESMGTPPLPNGTGGEKRAGPLAPTAPFKQPNRAPTP